MYDPVAPAQDDRALRARVLDLLFDPIAIPSFGVQEEVIARYRVHRLSAQGIPCQITERAASTVLGWPIRAAGFSATCDMTYLVNVAGIPTIILGLDGIDVVHQVNEHIALEEVAGVVQVYLGTIQAWAETA
jgi:acetylornithine deacetylase/succinyl-diaminopimelate desuccinylase-like protein